MARIRVKINPRAARKLLQSAAVEAELRRRGKRIADAAGPGHEVDTFTGRNRVRATVRTATPEAIVSQGRNRTLTRALDAGRG